MGVSSTTLPCPQVCACADESKRTKQKPFKFNKMIMIKELIFMLMLASGQVQPMHEQNDGHELYILCVENDEATEQKDKVFCYEHAYKEEIFEFIETGTFEYNEFLLTENQ